MFKAFFSLLFLTFVGITLFFGARWYLFLKTPINSTQTPFELVVESGTSMSHIAHQLKKEHRINNPDFLILLTRLKGASYQLKTGHYSITLGITPSEFIQKLVNGEVMVEKLTLVDGWTFKQLMKTINENSHITHTLHALSPSDLMKKLGSTHTSPEGLFLPETYLFNIGTTDFEILKKAYEAMQTVIKKEWAMRDPNTLYKTPYEALIVASLIQKETRLKEEYARVSAVIANRLKKGMLLQIDPTVIYGLGDHYKGILLIKQLKIDTPYNTYIRTGLPPTPIAFVTPETLHAALHPAPENLLYFVATGDGGHLFSSTLKAHERAVMDFRKKQQFLRLQEKQVEATKQILEKKTHE